MNTFIAYGLVGLGIVFMTLHFVGQLFKGQTKDKTKK